MLTLIFCFRMRSHFHGSLRRHPNQTPTTAYQQQSSSLTTLPATTSYHPQSSLSSPDGHLLLQPQPSLADAAKAAPSPFQSARPAPVPDVICCLCDKIADTILIPCNHVVLCAEHAKLSKKCPECRVSCCLWKLYIPERYSCICVKKKDSGHTLLPLKKLTTL